MQTIRLPQELIEAIVAQTDDRSTLLDCALVCRSWAAAAQRKLFETIVLAPTLFSGLSANITKTPIITRLHALASVSPHLLHYVKVLEFDPTCDAVHYLFASTTTLRELRVVNFTGEMAKGIEEINTMLSIPSVTRLSVREGPLYPGEIVPLLLNCPQLRSLSLSRVLSAAPGSLCLPNRRVQLDELSISRVNPEILDDLVTNVVDLSQAKSFSAEFHPLFYDQRRVQRAVPIVQGVLRSAQETLEHLHLDVHLTEPLHELLCISRLRTLKLHFPRPKGDASQARAEAALAWLTASLSTAEAASLERLEIHRVPTSDAGKAMALKLDAYLCALPSLREVIIMADAPETLFPALHQKGSLASYSRPRSLVERVRTPEV